MSEIIHPELAWIDGAFRRGREIVVDDDGRIAAVRAADPAPPGDGRALLPGFVNAHSHAFQRGLRGRGETFPEGAGSFWTWREAMYGLVESLDADAVYELALRAYGEMLAAGMTTVGEFHYLHHQHRGDWRLDEAVRAAARDAGIRLALLQAFYVTGDIGQPLAGGQRRFDGGDLGTYVAHVDALLADADLTRETVGVVIHSIRAVPRADLGRLASVARERGIVLHMHVEEQRAEIERCQAQYGATPMRVLLDGGIVSPTFTAVHCTHTAPDDAAAFAGAGGIACICPLTEGNLGDGLPDAAALVEAGGRLCLGSDSNARISMLEEMRWLEYGQRLRGERRGALRNRHGRVAPFLLDCATRHGAASLGIRAGTLETGAWADFVEVDLAHDALMGWTDETLAESIVCGAPDDVLVRSCVGGHWIAPLSSRR